MTRYSICKLYHLSLSCSLMNHSLEPKKEILTHFIEGAAALNREHGSVFISPNFTKPPIALE